MLAQAPEAKPWESRRAFTRALLQWTDALFDRGLHTAGPLQGLEHKPRERISYVPSPWYVLPLALRVTGVPRTGTFVDFGCGKGRIVHQAAKRPFRRVMGVEISPELADIARAVLADRASEYRCPDVEIVVSDVLEFPIPDDLAVAYLYDPFRGAILDAVVARIVDSLDRHPRSLKVIYAHPVEGGRFLATGRFRLVKELRGGLHDRRINRAAIFESV